jgi:hypothetical protein
MENDTNELPEVATALHHHEVLHTLLILGTSIDTFILENALFQDARYSAVYEKVRQAVDLLNEAYQEVGSTEF